MARSTLVDEIDEALRYIVINEPGAVELVERALACPVHGVLILTEEEMALWNRCVRVLPYKDAMKTCTDCKFFVRIGKDCKGGECRVNPPATMPATTHAYWPKVKDSDWCGSFKAKSDN